MKQSLLILFCAFLGAFLQCLQAINITRHYVYRAFVVSIMIGVSQLTILKMVPSVSAWQDGFAFVLGGLIGSQLSMLVNRKFSPKCNTSSAPNSPL